MTQDADQLYLLSIFHYIVGGLTVLLSLFPLIHLAIGLMIIYSPQTFGNGRVGPPAFFGWFFVIFATVCICFGLSLAGCMLATGHFIAQRKNYTFCFVIACIECILMPFGTILGIFSILVLSRESVKQLFAG